MTGPVPGYLGRVLSGGVPVGTCFQVAPGVLVTAWHVLNDIGGAALDNPVQVDPLAGGDPFGATVARLDPVHDLAVLTAANPAGPVDLLLTLTTERVRLSAPAVDISDSHGGVRPGLAEAVNEARRARARLGQVLAVPLPTGELAGDLSLARAGRLLGESFLPAPVAAELGRLLADAEQAYQPVRLGLAVTPELAWLPWEALPRPDGRGPLALDPLVRVYRHTDAAAPRLVPGPLRIVVAIAAPLDSGGGVVDYERHLRSVIAEVRSARQDDADVRVIPFAVLSAIREELERAPAHVLHVYCHGSPGKLELEDQDGNARLVGAEEFLAEAIPPGAMPPVITLSACYTDAAAADGASSFAAALGRHGACAVIGTETSVTDVYATRLFARLYGRLAQPGRPDVIAALADARRDVQRELETSTGRRDQELAALGEWAIVTVLAAAPQVAMIDPDNTRPDAPLPDAPWIEGLAARGPWYFVGRRAEQRRWPAELTSGSQAGIVICGIGGTGKTTLAAEVTARIRDREPGRILVSLTGALTLESLLGEVTSTIRRELIVRGQDVRALDVAARTDLSWQDRLEVLRTHVLDRVPVLLVLDNFEDNLRPDGDPGYAVRDEVLAELLAAWVTDPGRSRLLITCRYPFTLPSGVADRLSFRQLGALSRAETMKLAWSLPALDDLDEAQLEQVWRLAGGHPRSLEYLDALLSGGQAPYPDVTRRLHDAVTRRLDGADRAQWLAARTGLDAALAEIVALAADDVLLDQLLLRLDRAPGAAALLMGISVYREPVDLNAILFQVGQPDPDAEYVPDREAADQQISEILGAVGIVVDDSFDPANIPADIRAKLAPHVAELNRPPTPPFRSPPGFQDQVMAVQAASLLAVGGNNRDIRFFVHRWTATELASRASETGLRKAHQQAAAYWEWRVRVWPQARAADVHDMLEARHHLLRAGDAEAAGQATEAACLQLHTWGAWDQEAALVHDTLARLSADSPRRAAWIHQLGIIAQERGDYDEAARQFQRSLDINERLGNESGMASTYHHLGWLAQERGDYDEAARQYQRAGDISERLGDQAGLARSYSQFGILETDRGGPTASVIAWHVNALLIRFRLSVPELQIDSSRLSALRHELGTASFTGLLAEAVDDTELTQTVISWLDQWDNANESPA